MLGLKQLVLIGKTTIKVDFEGEEVKRVKRAV